MILFVSWRQVDVHVLQIYTSEAWPWQLPENTADNEPHRPHPLALKPILGNKIQIAFFVQKQMFKNSLKQMWCFHFVPYISMSTLS